MRLWLLALLLVLVLPTSALAAAGRPERYSQFDQTVTGGSATARGAAFKALLDAAAANYIYLAPTTYEVNNPITIDRDSVLFIHGVDPYNTVLIATNPSQPLFNIVTAPHFNLSTLRCNPTQNTATVNSRCIQANNTVPVMIELQDVFVERSMVELKGPGSLQCQHCTGRSDGWANADFVIDHPDMLSYFFQFGGSNSGQIAQSGLTGPYRIWQKRGRLQVYSATVAGALGPADFRIDTRSNHGPHVLADIRSEGVNGALYRTGAASRLLEVPTTSENVEVVVKASSGIWLTAPGTFSDGDFNDDTVDVVNEGPNHYLTMNAHPFVNGEGPVRSSGSFRGLSTGTDYYLHKIDANSVSVHTSQANALADTSRVPLTSTPTGSITLTSSYLNVVQTSGIYTDNQGPIRLRSDATLNSSLSASTDYWIGVKGAGTIVFRTSSGGATVPIALANGTGRTSILTADVPDIAANCKLVNWNAAGRLWLLGNFTHICGRNLVEGTAPNATIISIGNALNKPDPFPVTARRVISTADQFNNRWWMGVTTAPVIRWIPSAVQQPHVANYVGVPEVPLDSVPRSIPVPIMDVLLPDPVLSVLAFGANGNGSFDNTSALQAAFDYRCNNASPAQTLLYFPAGVYKITDTLYLNHHTGGTCHGRGAYGGIIAGAGSAVTRIEMASGTKKPVFESDGFGIARVQGITFKTWPWVTADPQEPNFHIDRYTTGNYIASTAVSFYDTVFDGGWSGFAAGVKDSSSNQCDVMSHFYSTFKNAFIGHNSGHQNAIHNLVMDSRFVNNVHSIGSSTVAGVPPAGGESVVYRSISTGTTGLEIFQPGISGHYSYDWDSTADAYVSMPTSSNYYPLFFDRVNFHPPTGIAYPFDSAAGMGFIFLYSTLTHGSVKVGTATDQTYAAKLHSTIPDWASSNISPNGQLEELVNMKVAGASTNFWQAGDTWTSGDSW